MVFDKVEHRYYLGEKILRGITSTLVHRAFPHTYDGIPESVLAKAADRGTRVHEAIDAYETSSEFSDLPELVTYEDLKTKHGLTYVGAISLPVASTPSSPTKRAVSILPTSRQRANLSMRT